MQMPGPFELLTYAPQQAEEVSDVYSRGLGFRGFRGLKGF